VCVDVSTRRHSKICAGCRWQLPRNSRRIRHQAWQQKTNLGDSATLSAPMDPRRHLLLRVTWISLPNPWEISASANPCRGKYLPRFVPAEFCALPLHVVCGGNFATLRRK
jgi:hypothetical protein